MSSSHDFRSWRRTWALLSTRTLGLAAVVGALGGAGVGCKANETPKAPDAPAAAPAAAEAAPATAAAGEPAATAAASPAAPSDTAAPSVYPFELKRLDGTETKLSAWEGKVLLIVNTASKCGYTPQYQGLQELHVKYSPRGFEVLGFPSNDFGGQEPGTAEEISKFCISIYDVNFPMFEKTKVVGEGRSPLYALLSDAHGAPKWNFHKYLIDKHGHPVQAWPSGVVPGSPEIASAIEAQLAAN
jgi:glutathione peroxidase